MKKSAVYFKPGAVMSIVGEFGLGIRVEDDNQDQVFYVVTPPKPEDSIKKAVIKYTDKGAYFMALGHRRYLSEFMTVTCPTPQPWELRVIEYLREEQWSEIKSNYGSDLPIFETDFTRYADDTSLSKEHLRKILESEDPQETFDETMWEIHDQSAGEVYDEFVEEVKEDLEKHEFEVDEDILTDFLHEHAYQNYPTDDYLNHVYRVNIIVDTGDGNYDFTLNSAYPHYNGKKDEPMDKKASLIWLAKQQGKPIRAAFKRSLKGVPKTEKFVCSAYEEVLNCTSGLAALVFLVEMPLKDIIQLYKAMKHQDANGHQYDATKRPNCGTIRIDQKAWCGLVDVWSGAGGSLDIELEKDVVLPVRYIHSAYPEGAQYEYSIDDIYGLIGKAWQANVSLNLPKNLS